MLTQESIDQMWRGAVQKLYLKHPRNRAYAVNEDAIRGLCHLYMLCRNRTAHQIEVPSIFHHALEQLTDTCNINVLQPLPPEEPKVPPMWKDPWGHELPNPFVTKDVKAQSLLMQRDPELAKWLRGFATDPYGSLVALQDETAKVRRLRAITYDSDTHVANIFVRKGVSETEKGRFMRDHAELVPILQREAVPVRFPFGANFNLTQQSAMLKDPQLSELITEMQNLEAAYVERTREAAKTSIEAAQERLKELEHAR
jgi:hypothetical protein